MPDAIPRRLAPRLLAAGMAAPLALALFAHVAGTTPAPVAAAPARGALVFDQYLVNLGHVPATQDVIAYFDFTNRGSNPVEVQSLEPSCGCLRPRMEKLERIGDKPAREGVAEKASAGARLHREKKVYEPGESGFFSVRVQTANQNPGQKEYTVTVKYKDPEPRETVVLFRVVLPDDQVIVRPLALAVYQLGEANMETEPQKFEVIDRRGQHLNIVKVECSNKDVGVEEVGNDVDEAGVWHGRFQVKVPAKFPPGHTETIIRVHTDDPAAQYSVLRIPLFLEGPSQRKNYDSHVRPTGATAPQKSTAASSKSMRPSR
jgi:hypothetical protein